MKSRTRCTHASEVNAKCSRTRHACGARADSDAATIALIDGTHTAVLVVLDAVCVDLQKRVGARTRSVALRASTQQPSPFYLPVGLLHAFAVAGPIEGHATRVFVDVVRSIAKAHPAWSAGMAPRLEYLRARAFPDACFLCVLDDDALARVFGGHAAPRLRWGTKSVNLAPKKHRGPGGRGKRKSSEDAEVHTVRVTTASLELA